MPAVDRALAALGAFRSAGGRSARASEHSRIAAAKVAPADHGMRVISFTAWSSRLPSSAVGVQLDHDRRLSELDRTLLAETDEHGGALDNYFERAHSVVLLTANSPAFARVLAEPGSTAQKVRRQSRNLARRHAPPRLSGAAVPGEHR